MEVVDGSEGCVPPMPSGSRGLGARRAVTVRKHPTGNGCQEKENGLSIRIHGWSTMISATTEPTTENHNRLWVVSFDIPRSIDFKCRFQELWVELKKLVRRLADFLSRILSPRGIEKALKYFLSRRLSISVLAMVLDGEGGGLRGLRPSRGGGSYAEGGMSSMP